MNLKNCLEKGYLKKSEPDRQLCEKEIAESKYDLERAEKAFKEEDYKWCIVKAYYSMFHAAKAVLFNLGYIERKHIAIIAVLDELYKDGKIESKYVTYYKAAMSSREDADYHYSYSKEIAKYELEVAKEFLNEMRKIAK